VTCIPRLIRNLMALKRISSVRTTRATAAATRELNYFMAEAYEPYPKDVMTPLVVSVTAAAVVAIFSVYFSTVPVIQVSVVRALPMMVHLVPSVPSISSETRNMEASEIVLLTQWLFAPVYAFVWFYTAPPWAPRMRYTILLKARTFTPAKRSIGMPLGTLVLAAWLLGDFGIIGFPTFYNGKFAYPLDHAVPQIKLIYGSPIALAIAKIRPLQLMNVFVVDHPYDRWLASFCASRARSPGRLG